MLLHSGAKARSTQLKVCLAVIGGLRCHNETKEHAMAANKPTDKQSVSKKSDEYNPVNMAGKKTSPKNKAGNSTGEKEATPSDYNPDRKSVV